MVRTNRARKVMTMEADIVRICLVKSGVAKYGDQVCNASRVAEIVRSLVDGSADEHFFRLYPSLFINCFVIYLDP